MTNEINYILSTIILLTIIIINIYQRKKQKNIYKDTLYKKVNTFKKVLYLLSCLTFIIVLILNLMIYGNDPSLKTTITYLINSLTIATLVSPLTLSNLYITSFKDEEKYSHTKTIITNKIDKQLFKLYKKADINIILLSEKENKLNIPIIEENNIKKSLLSKNIQIKTKKLDILDKLINKDTTIKEFNNIQDIYTKIYESRGTHDNFIRNIKYIIHTYLSLILSYIFLSVMGFPPIYNLLLVLILKLSTIITSNIIYKKLPYDKDIMERKVKNKNIFMCKEEIFLTIIESFCISFAITIPYMFTLSQGGSQELANTLYYSVFVYIELLLVFTKLNDSFFIINIIKSLKNIRLILFTIFSIGIIVLFNFLPIFNTRNIYLQNNISCILFSLIPIVFIELTKLSRYFSTKGKKKHELKNHKKQRRS